MQAVTGHFFRRFFGQTAHLVQQTLAQFQQRVVVLGPFRFDLHRAIAGTAARRRDRLAQNGRGGGRSQFLAGRFARRLFDRLFLRSHSVSVVHSHGTRRRSPGWPEPTPFESA